MGSNRARVIVETDVAELKCVVDLNADLAKEKGEELGTDWATNLDDVLGRDDIDCVMVMTPSGTHADLGVEAAKAGKHVITTKPMDVSTEACDRLIAACDGCGCQVSGRLSEPLCRQQLSCCPSPASGLARPADFGGSSLQIVPSGRIF